MNSLFDLQGKTALITGASSGLGKRFAYVLSQAGAKVILAARRIDKLEEVAKDIRDQGGQAIPFQMDVSDKHSVTEAIDQLISEGEKIDILVNNAGIAKGSPLFESDLEGDFESMMQTNVMGVWYVTKAVAAHMKDQRIDGSIINIASVNGASAPVAGASGYCASKAAVIQMTKTLVGELSKHKIRINAISPGLTETEKNEATIKQMGDEIIKTIPLKFIAVPEDLDATILYLASNKASRYVTGSCLTIDGGVSWGGK